MRMTKQLAAALAVGIGSWLICLHFYPFAIVDCLYVMLSACLFLEATNESR